MKKNSLSTTILAFALLTLLTGCNGDDSNALTAKSAATINLDEVGGHIFGPKGRGKPVNDCTRPGTTTKPTDCAGGGSGKTPVLTVYRDSKEEGVTGETCWIVYDSGGRAQEVCF